MIAKILFILNISNNCTDELYSLENNSYFNETLEMMDCIINDYYNINYTFIYFYKFNDSIEEKIENITEEINNVLINYRMDENFLYEFLENQNYSLEPYEEIDLSDISYDFEDIESTISYYSLPSHFLLRIVEDLLYISCMKSLAESASA